jgi:diguanylate cyclase (GGDEF)-like protein
MDIPPRPGPRTTAPVLVAILLSAGLALACLMAGALFQSLLDRDSLGAGQARATLDAFQGPQGAGSAGSLPLHQLDPTGKLSPGFRLFSQNPVNPTNLPDDLERQALLAFQKGAGEFSAAGIKDGRTILTTARPLFARQDCLRCHASQGWAEGQLRGGIAVSQDNSGSERLTGMRLLALTGLVLAALGLAAAIPLVTRRLINQTLGAMENRMADLAATDELTGLANRRYFLRRAEEEFSRCIRHGHSLGLLMIDIDHFKLINDFYGHQNGDQALQLLATQLIGNCRLSDLVARYGGEEFVILLPEIDRAGAQNLAEKLRGVVAANSMRLAAQPDGDQPGSRSAIPEASRFNPLVLRYTISVGVACLEAPALQELGSPSRLVALADAALYKAKHTGRNRVMVN